MISFETYKELALALPEAEEEPHFEKTSFRVKKKIFATYNANNHTACIKLDPIQQSVYSAFDNTIIYAVPNAWGKQGWTFINLKKVRKTVLRDAIKDAFLNVAPKKITDQLKK